MVRVRVGVRVSVSEREASCREAYRRKAQRNRDLFELYRFFSRNQTGVLYFQNINYKHLSFLNQSHCQEVRN